MAIVRGASHWVRTRDGVVSAVVFYDDADGRPARIDTSRSTLRDFEVEFKGVSRDLKFVVPMGDSSRGVLNVLAREIDMRKDSDTFISLSEWTFTLRM